MTCTPYFTLLNVARSHGPVTSIPIFPRVEQVAVGGVARIQVHGLVGDGHGPQRVQRGQPGGRVERRLLVVRGEQLAAGLPEQRLPVPDRVLGARRDVRRAELLDRRVGQLLRVGHEVLPGPAGARRLQPGLGEQRLVVDHGQVVHQRRDADHLAVDGGHGALAGPEVVPVDAGPLHHLGEVHHLGDLGHVGGPRAVEVGDVRRAAAAHRGQHLLQRVVAVDVQGVHFLAGVRRLGLGDQVREGLLCHSVRDTQAFLTRLTGADPERVRFLTAGFNHQAFVLRFEQDGESLYPRLAEVIDASPELQRRVRVEIYRRFGYFPTESRENTAEYVPWFMRHDDQIDRFRIFVGDYLERSEENLRELEELRRALDSDDPLDLTPENELASLFIHALETGTERELHVNIRNGGLIASLPDACCVEVPCVVGAQGAKPVPVGALPPQLAALNRTFLNVVELTVRAALEESRDHVYQAALLDPNTAATLTTTQVVAMCDDLFAAHRDLLPPAFRS